MFVFLALLVATCALQVHTAPAYDGPSQQELDRAREIQRLYENTPKPFDTSNWKPTEQNWLKNYVDVNENFRVGVTGSLEPSFGVWGQYRF